jgi:hypothetical protein
MNIHIEDRDLFDKLVKSSLLSIDIGSIMYGLKHKDSDTDRLYIYATSDRELNSFFMTHHQLQYKENGVDYIFVNIHNFIRNCLIGDSTINFEVINSTTLIGTCLEFLYNMRFSFYNYKIMRSYLGLAKRDIKSNIDCKTDFEKNKKVSHVYRGLITSEKILEFDDIFLNKFEISYVKEVLWNIKDYKERKTTLDILSNDVEELRKNINELLNKKEIVHFMKIEEQLKLQNFLEELTNSDFYKSKKMDNFDMSLIYDANENGIEY